jgi:diguanylate cyclase (GGDEF)-like protein
MAYDQNSLNTRKWIKRARYALVFGSLFWTAILILSLYWNLYQNQQIILENARITARTAFEKDVLYRAWNSGHGGVYVPPTDKTPPNPYLADMPNRDLKISDQTTLTLINPAYMTRQVFELQTAYTGVLGHITSLKPIRPENAADSWEQKALAAFEAGEKEISSVETINNGSYLRLMRPLLVEERCLKCHQKQGYKVGEIRGGISESVPLAPIAAAQEQSVRTIWIGHSVIWLIGFLGLNIALIFLGNSLKRQEKAEERLVFVSSHDALTGLFNRAVLEDTIKTLDQGNRPISVLVGDVDNLKITNDTLGHTSGDDLLRHTAQVLRSALRSDDILARVGGDEFIAVLPGVDAPLAQKILARIHKYIQDHNSQNPDLQLSISFGITTALFNEPLTETIHRADQVMYAEKASKKRNQAAG